jgi:anti-sigma B factor antagonist
MFESKQEWPESTRSADLTDERAFTMMLEGELGKCELKELDTQIAELSVRGRRRIVLEFSDVTHFDYRAVPRLVARANHLRELGGDLKLCAMSPYLRTIFKAAGAHTAFEFYSQLEDAFRAFDTSTSYSH